MFFEKPLLITGLPRSGTSMTAGIFTHLGVWAGTTVPPGPQNPKGFFEHVLLREQITKGILSAYQFDPLGVRALPKRDFHPELKLTAGDANTPKSLAEVIRFVIESDGYKDESPWLYKGAKMALLWRLFNEAFPAANWVIVRRSREGFIRSCLRTDFMAQHSTDPRFWDRLADLYDVRLADLSQSVANVYEVSAEKLVDGDYGEIQGICTAVGLAFDHEVVSQFVEPRFLTTKTD